ncbi:MAG: PAS domain S-box protein [Candidatus Cloacimonetes bacterium]|nr:PAS domain S-box protein [Candidatus Cloacimonadota bacterium]
MTSNSSLEWKHVFNSIKDSVIILDTNGIIRDCNKAFLKLVDKPKIRVIGSDCSKIIYDRTDKLENCPFLRSKRTKKRESITIEKGDKWFNVDVDPILDENKKVTGFVQFMSNITKRKKLQEALLNSEERYRSLSEATFQAIFISEKGVCIEQNSIAEKMFGYTLSDAIGRNGSEWIAPEYREIVINNMVSGYEKPYEVIALRKDGSIFPAEIQGKMIPYKGRTVRVTALRDITERKKAEKALRESEEKFRTLTENINVGIYRNTVGAKGKFIEANPAIVKMFGFKNKKEFLAHNVSELYLHPEERQKFNDEMFKSGFVKDEELQLKKKDGKHFWGSVSAVTIKDKNGHVQFYDGIIEDITEHKKAEEELRNSRERLKMLNKIIRHDISNDFIVIQSAINIFRRSSDTKMINEIESRVDKSLMTIDSYRKYESFIDLNQDLEELEITELFNGIIVEFPKIEFNIHGKCKVFADNALGSVFTNLISNSIKHGNSTKIDIKISSENNICKIKFMDNGTGISDKIKDKIFDEGFFHGQTGNTGIGLHIVRKTIERYRGSISVEENEPNGAVFIINLKMAL